MDFSICICSYNRSELLKETLESLLNLDPTDLALVELIVVDNNSDDDTKEISQKLLEKFPKGRYLFEEKKGLSYARNTAYELAETDWICYLDDDVQVPKEFIQQIIKHLKRGEYKAFGGKYLPWYKYGKPYWYMDKYGTYDFPYSKPTELGNNEYLVGAIMVFHKSILLKFNGFNPDLGMRGGTVGYGEETELQMKIKDAGIPILYDPDIVIQHLVHKFKIELNWFFVSAFSLGRDSILMNSKRNTLWLVVSTTMVMLGMLLVHLFYFTPKLLFKRDYYIQNWLIDVFKKIAKRVGVIYTSLISWQDQKMI